jgi:hypothetical protein
MINTTCKCGTQALMRLPYRLLIAALLPRLDLAAQAALTTRTSCNLSITNKRMCAVASHQPHNGQPALSRRTWRQYSPAYYRKVALLA